MSDQELIKSCVCLDSTTWFIVGISTRMALELNLATPSQSQFPADLSERQLSLEMRNFERTYAYLWIIECAFVSSDACGFRNV